MEFQFVIPTSNNDLLETDGNNYFVKRVFNSNEIPDLLKGSFFNCVKWMKILFSYIFITCIVVTCLKKKKKN